MARNKMNDLRDHLFAQLERLGDEELTAEQLQIEMNRAKALSSVAGVIVGSAKVELDYMKAIGAEEIKSPLFDQKKLE